MKPSDDTFVDVNMPEAVLHRLNELRINGQDCDFTLYNDSVSFRLHKCLLRATSPVIDKACQETEDTKEFRLEYLSEHGLKTLIEYIYSGRITLTGEICMEMYTAATRLEMVFMMDSCVRYLKNHLDPTNCITYLQYSFEMGNEELKNVCIQFCVDNFEDLIHQEGYLNLPPEALCAILSNPELYIGEEVALFNAIRKWLDHDPDGRVSYAEKLSEHVRYQLFDVRNLLEMLNSTEYAPFHDHIQKALMDFGMLAEHLARQKWERKPSENRAHEDKQSRLSPNASTASLQATVCETARNHILAVLGGRSQDKKLIKDIVCFRVRKPAPIREDLEASGIGDSEKALKQMQPNFDLTPISYCNLQTLPCPRKGFGVAHVANNVFLVGGMPASVMRTVDVYVISLEEWMVGPPMRMGRGWHGVTSTELAVYAIGGVDAKGEQISSCEMLDIRSDKWQTLPPMPRARMSLAACMLNTTELYVACGLKEASVDCFDTVAGKWRAVAPLPGIHEAPGMLSFEGSLYLFGGMNASNFLACVHRYDRLTDVWTPVASMPQASAFHAPVLLEDHAFVIGGRSSEGSCNIIQVYNMKQNSWYVLPQTLPSARSSSCAIAIALN